jgi:hypothetical protein
MLFTFEMKTGASAAFTPFGVCEAQPDVPWGPAKSGMVRGAVWTAIILAVTWALWRYASFGW